MISRILVGLYLLVACTILLMCSPAIVMVALLFDED